MSFAATPIDDSLDYILFRDDSCDMDVDTTIEDSPRIISQDIDIIEKQQQCSNEDVDPMDVEWDVLVQPFLCLPVKFKFPPTGKTIHELFYGFDNDVHKYFTKTISEFYEKIEKYYFGGEDGGSRHSKSGRNLYTIVFLLQLKEDYKENSHIIICKYMDETILIPASKLKLYLPEEHKWNSLKESCNLINVGLDSIIEEFKNDKKVAQYDILFVNNKSTIYGPNNKKCNNHVDMKYLSPLMTNGVKSMSSYFDIIKMNENIKTHKTNMEYILNKSRILTKDIVNNIPRNISSDYINIINDKNRILETDEFNLLFSAERNMTLSKLREELRDIVKKRFNDPNLLDFNMCILKHINQYIANVLYEKKKVYLMTEKVYYSNSKTFYYKIKEHCESEIKSVFESISAYKLEIGTKKKKEITINIYDIYCSKKLPENMKVKNPYFSVIENEKIPEYESLYQTRDNKLNIYIPNGYMIPDETLTHYLKTLLDKKYDNPYDEVVYGDLKTNLRETYGFDDKWVLSDMKDCFDLILGHVLSVLASSNDLTFDYIINYILHILVDDIVTGKWLRFIGPNGAGKSIFFTHLNPMFAESQMYIMPDTQFLNNRFNSHMEKLKLVVIEEIEFNSNQRNKFKSSITAEYNIIEKKFVDGFKQTRATVNYISLENINSKNDYKLDDNERRMVPITTTSVSTDNDIKSLYFTKLSDRMKRFMRFFIDSCFVLFYVEDFNFNEEPTQSIKEKEKKSKYFSYSKFDFKIVKSILTLRNDFLYHTEYNIPVNLYQVYLRKIYKKEYNLELLKNNNNGIENPIQENDLIIKVLKNKLIIGDQKQKDIYDNKDYMIHLLPNNKKDISEYAISPYINRWYRQTVYDENIENKLRSGLEDKNNNKNKTSSSKIDPDIRKFVRKLNVLCAPESGLEHDLIIWKTNNLEQTIIIWPEKFLDLLFANLEKFHKRNVHIETCFINLFGYIYPSKYIQLCLIKKGLNSYIGSFLHPEDNIFIKYGKYLDENDMFESPGLDVIRILNYDILMIYYDAFTKYTSDCTKISELIICEDNYKNQDLIRKTNFLNFLKIFYLDNQNKYLSKLKDININLEIISILTRMITDYCVATDENVSENIEKFHVFICYNYFEQNIIKYKREREFQEDICRKKKKFL